LLQNLIKSELIECELIARTKSSAIEQLTNLLLKEKIIEKPEEFIKLVRRREELESTGIGDGIAIPHARAKGIKELKIAFGKSTEGIEFNSLDNKKVYLILLIAAPEDAGKTYLQAIAKTARFLKSKVIRKALLNSKTPEEVMSIIRDFDNLLPEGLTVETKEGRVIYKKS